MPLNKQAGNMYNFVDFTWNPIKGRCPHGCSYCVDGETLILMSSGLWKKIKDVEKEEIISISFSPRLHLTKARIINLSTANKESVELTFDNGINLICSLDHKLLSNDHKRWVESRLLTLSSNIYSVVRQPPVVFQENENYVKGWLAGMIEGDGTINHYKYESNVYQFRLALKDEEGIKRAGTYLKCFEVTTIPFKFKNQGGDLYAIRTSNKDSFFKIKKLIQFKDNLDFCRGYLGGMFDAEGCTLKHTHNRALRIFNQDTRRLVNLQKALKQLDFDFSIVKDKSVITGINVLGGFREIIRFISLTNPSISRKKPSWDITRIKGSNKLIKIEKKGNRELFDIETSSGNFIANGIVVHNCYMRQYWSKLREPYLDEKCLSDNLGSGRTIFVGSSIDMFADEIPSEWIERVLRYCHYYSDNTYLFQTKNPLRFWEFLSLYRSNWIFGTTIETNNSNLIFKAPHPINRAETMASYNIRKMVSIEPIMDFDEDTFADLIKTIKPEFVSIGADSKNSNLVEPDGRKIRGLIESLSQFTEVRIKKNLNRILKGGLL